MKGWGYLIALLGGVLGGWIAQQFWLTGADPEQIRTGTELLRTDARLQQLERMREAQQSPDSVESEATLFPLNSGDSLTLNSQLSGSGSIASASQGDDARMDAIKERVKAMVEQQAFVSAIEYLYDERLGIPFEQEDAFQVYIVAVVEDMENQLQEQLQWERIIEIYRLLVSLQPEYVPFTLSLVHWLIEVRSYDEAEQNLVVARNDLQYANQVIELSSRIQERRQIQAQDSQAIQLQRVGQHYLAEVELEGGLSVDLLIDTGASLTVIKSSLAEQYGLDQLAASPVSLKTANGAIEGEKVSLSSLTLNDLQLANVEVGIVPLPGFKYDGLLGMNVLGRFKFFIDQEQSVLYLGNP